MQATDQRLDENVRRVVDRATDSGAIVGAVVLVRRGGREACAHAAGWADREARTPTRLDTIFRWASLTKPVTATLTMALVERGVLSLDDLVTRFLPDFRPRLPSGEAPDITVRQLITHTAGLTYGFFEPPNGPYRQAGVSDGMDQPGLSLEENLRRVASAPLVRAPGSGWGYSISTDVLGAVLASAAQTPLPNLLAELVTGPLGMKDASFGVADRARLATPYADGETAPTPMGALQLIPFGGGGAIAYAPGRALDPASYPSGGGGMSGTADDFMRLLEALRTGGQPVLSAQSVAALSTIKPGDVALQRPGSKWPLGWSVLDDPEKAQSPQSRGTWSWGGVYGASWFVDLARELSVVVVTNTAVAGMAGPFPTAVRDAIYAALSD